MTQAIENPNATPAQVAATTPAESTNPTVAVGKRVKGFISNGTLHLPKDYSPDNALKSAFLKLTETLNKEYKPVLTHCTIPSIQNALLSMVMQGLDVAKNQGYFIAYGDKLTFQRSYFGDMALAERIRPGIEIYSGIVYEGQEDNFKFSIERGRKIVTMHEQTLEDLDRPIKAVYCGIIDENGVDLGVELMTIERVKESWKMSKTYKPVPEKGKEGTHQKFEAEMALRTVIRKRCLSIINTASDAHLREAIQKSEADAIEAEMAEEVAANANGEVLDIEETPQALGASAESLDQVPTVTETQEEKAPAAASTGLSSEFD